MAPIALPKLTLLLHSDAECLQSLLGQSDAKYFSRRDEQATFLGIKNLASARTEARKEASLTISWKATSFDIRGKNFQAAPPIENGYVSRTWREKMCGSVAAAFRLVVKLGGINSYRQSIRSYKNIDQNIFIRPHSGLLNREPDNLV